MGVVDVIRSALWCINIRCEPGGATSLPGVRRAVRWEVVYCRGLAPRAPLAELWARCCIAAAARL